MNAAQTTQNDVRKPRLGERPKRGIKDITLKILNKEAKFNPHHQKQLLIELLEFKQGEAKLDDIVELIESNENYWKRLNTVQSPYNCMVYHAKQLSECGFLQMKIVGATSTEIKQAKETPIAVVEYARNRALRETEKKEMTEEEKKIDESTLNVATEVIKQPAKEKVS